MNKRTHKVKQGHVQQLKARKVWPGQGGSRYHYSAPNEIADMRIFDHDPGKTPSQENGSPPPKLPDEGEKADRH